MRTNPLVNTDSYKISHEYQYPPLTTDIFSYFESRGGWFENTVFFGIQYWIKNFLNDKITVEDVKEADEFYKLHQVPFNTDGFMKIAIKHKGYFPVKIRSVKEGSIIPVKNALVTIESTDPELFWVVSFLETSLVRLWYSINVASLSFEIKKVIWSYLQKTSDDPKSEIDFKLWDFGSRGSSSRETAAIGGAANLVNFRGSDTIDGIWLLRNYYNSPCAATSIPAMEHSSVTSWGKENETLAYQNMLNKFAKPGSVIACVSDSYNIYNAIEHIWGEQLKEQVIKSGATVVIRLDSGDPKTVVVNSLKLLESKFGCTINTKGYKVLNNVRILQGDGVNLDSIKEILEAMTVAGYSTTNITLGCGGALLQRHDRDSFKMAQKCCSIKVDGEWRDVFKDPITDPGKVSKKGRLDLIKENGIYKTVRLDDEEICKPNSVMQTMYENGGIYCNDSIDEIRKRASGLFI